MTDLLMELRRLEVDAPNNPFAKPAPPQIQDYPYPCPTDWGMIDLKVLPENIHAAFIEAFTSDALSGECQTGLAEALEMVVGYLTNGAMTGREMRRRRYMGEDTAPPTPSEFPREEIKTLIETADKALASVADTLKARSEDRR